MTCPFRLFRNIVFLMGSPEVEMWRKIYKVVQWRKMHPVFQSDLWNVTLSAKFASVQKLYIYIT